MKNKPTNPNQKIRNHTYTSYNEEDDQTDCSRQTARCNGYADLPLGCVCEGVEVSGRPACTEMKSSPI